MITPRAFVTPTGDPVQNNRNQFLDRLMNIPAIGSNAVANFTVLGNSTTKGVDVSFQITNASGMGSISLLRASVLDIKQASVLQTWTAREASFAWSDTDQALQSVPQVFYWLRLEPSTITKSEVDVGPQNLLLNPSLLPPLALAAISASHGAASNGIILVTVNLSAIPEGDSVMIYVQGYLANASFVAIAQKSSAPMQFNMQATGETVTFKAIAVSSGGSEATSGPTCTLTLNGSATAPAQIQNVTVTQFSTGNQVSWPASLEIGVTQYQIWRGNRGGGFGAASRLATVAASGSGTVIYLDTAGLTGDFEYYIIAVSGAGNSPASIAANPIVLFSSSQLPPNVPTNQIGGAVVDSIDAGSSATIRIYGGGGVGSSWMKVTGYGSVTRPAGTITGLTYSGAYYVYFNVATSTYF